MHSRTWKRFEHETAKELGTSRELFAGPGGDVKHNLFLIDTKNRARWSISAWFAKLKKDAGKRDKIPLLVVKEPGKHTKLAICELHVFSSLLKAAGWGPDSTIQDFQSLPNFPKSEFSAKATGVKEKRNLQRLCRE